MLVLVLLRALCDFLLIEGCGKINCFSFFSWLFLIDVHANSTTRGRKKRSTQKKYNKIKIDERGKNNALNHLIFTTFLARRHED